MIYKAPDLKSTHFRSSPNFFSLFIFNSFATFTFCTRNIYILYIYTTSTKWSIILSFFIKSLVIHFISWFGFLLVNGAFRGGHIRWHIFLYKMNVNNKYYPSIHLINNPNSNNLNLLQHNHHHQQQQQPQLPQQIPRTFSSPSIYHIPTNNINSNNNGFHNRHSSFNNRSSFYLATDDNSNTNAKVVPKPRSNTPDRYHRRKSLNININTSSPPSSSSPSPTTSTATIPSVSTNTNVTSPSVQSVQSIQSSKQFNESEYDLILP